MDGSGGHLAGAHGQDDGGSAGNGIAAGEHALAGGHFFLVDDEAALPVGLQTGSGGADQGVGASAQGHDNRNVLEVIIFVLQYLAVDISAMYL